MTQIELSKVSFYYIYGSFFLNLILINLKKTSLHHLVVAIKS